MGARCGAGWAVRVCPGCAHWWQVVGSCGRLWACPLRWSCVPLLLSAPLLCLWCIGLQIWLIWRFKAVFSAFLLLGVGLCCLGALRGLWGFCARVELGGFEACCVFAPIFPLLCPCLFLCLFFACLCFCLFVGFALVVLSSCPLLSLCPCCSLWVCCCFLFPYGL